MDYFNNKERESQKKFRNFRDKFFSNLVKGMKKANIRPNHISFLGVLFLIMAALLTKEYWILITLLLLLYVLMDGIDGPLARATGNTHNGGALVDIFSDQLGVVIIPIAAIYHLNVDGIVSLLFSTGYLSIIALVTYENELENYKARSFLRVKYFVYVLYVFSLVLSSSSYLFYMFLISGIYYWLESFFRVFSIHKFFDEKGSK